jgi:hypothetical protein
MEDVDPSQTALLRERLHQSHGVGIDQQPERGKLKMSAVSELVAAWRNEGLLIRPGCPARTLDTFEARENVRIPADLREFLTLANGAEMDVRGFSFWPLDDYDSYDRAAARHDAQMPIVSDPSSYYVFCDYLHWSWAYSIRLDSAHGPSVGNPVVPIGMTEIFVVASSFSEFADLVREDSPQLYPR